MRTAAVHGVAHRKPASAGFFVAAALLLGLLMTGCATPQVERLNQAWPADLPPQVLLSDVPFFPQEDYECGPAALATLLQAAGVAASPAELKPQVFLPGRRGSLQVELMVAARRHGLPAYRIAPTVDALLHEVAAGHPVLVFQNLSLPIYPVWHYAVVIGFDRQRQLLLLNSGVTQRQEISLFTFERTWARGDFWAMVALPTTTLPATADADTMAAAIAALERVDAPAARKAYEAGLRRWPSQPVLLLGAGNAAYASGDLAGAAAAYRHAVAVQPDAADAWNNLAQVLMEQGDKAAARPAAERAVALGGPRLASYQALAQKLRTP
ncbi:PA2778 family cysteine peptidase [soil metagenome]